VPQASSISASTCRPSASVRKKPPIGGVFAAETWERMPCWFMGAPRSTVPHSGDRSDIPSSRSALRRLLPMLLRRPQSTTAFVTLAAALALIPLLLATFAFGYAFRAGERDHADSRLAGAVETVRGRLVTAAATATGAARTLGESRSVQLALLRHD